MPAGRGDSTCGACWEYMIQLGKDISNIEILRCYEMRKTITLKELIPDWWGYEWFENQGKLPEEDYAESIL